MLNTLSKIAVVLNTIVVLVFVLPVLYKPGMALDSKDMAVIALNLLSAALNAAALATNKEA